MARPYAGEMARLSETFAWAAEVDLDPLRQAVRTACSSSLRAIGSGGSLTGAHALASLHQRYTGHLAAVATPLEAIERPLDAAVATWLLSAGGSNADIMAATKALILREPCQIGVLCGRETSPLADLCRRHPFVDLLLYPPPPPVGKDGFLATNSLLGFTALLMRAYATEFGKCADWEDTAEHVKPLLLRTAALEAWEAATEPLWTRPTTLVLHGPSTRIGAIDLESKFTEAALGHVQIADYRNFAHGRHHWLAKRSETSGVLALVTDTDRTLADRTLNLIPEDVPQARLVFDGGPCAVALASLLAALRITGWAGRAQGMDPGRPRVPEFGRKLYHLRPPRPKPVAKPHRLSPLESAAIARKAGIAPGRIAPTEIDRWRDALAAFLVRLRNARFAGVVLDYDGTVVDTRRRFETAEPDMISELVRLAQMGIHIGVATGRGASVRRDLQECVPDILWPLFLIGYYNGAEVASLDNDSVPNGSHNVCTGLQPLAEALRDHPDLSGAVHQEDRPLQITLEAPHAVPMRRLLDVAHQVIRATDNHGATAVCSSHSVDIVAPGVSKLNVIQHLRTTVGDEPILVIGDRGRPPGNDHELLSEPFALGVADVSVDHTTCWHLGTPGQRGPTVTLQYLSALQAQDGRLRFATGALR